MDSSVEDPNTWRSQLPAGARQRIVNKIMEHLEKHLPVDVPARTHMLQKIAERLEGRIFTAASSKTEYLRKISLRMLWMESRRHQNAIVSVCSVSRPRECTVAGDPNSAEMDSSIEDPNTWRSQLLPGARQRIINKIMEDLEKHLPVDVPEGMPELQKIAERLEGKIFSAASSRVDYLRKISLKLLQMESRPSAS